MKKPPIGITTLREIITEGYAYVDKSRFIHVLSDTGKYFLLSRPRRFGKSLLVDTLKEAFEGNQELFRGLWLEDHWDWETRHPMINIRPTAAKSASTSWCCYPIFTLNDSC